MRDLLLLVILPEKMSVPFDDAVPLNRHIFEVMTAQQAYLSALRNPCPIDMRITREVRRRR